MTLPSQQDQQFSKNPRWPFLTLRSTFQSELPYKTHQHDTVSLGVILEGITCSTIDGQARQLSVGDIVLIPAQCAHSCNPLAGTARSYHMLFMDDAWCVELLGGDSAKQTFAAKQSVIHCSPQTQGLLQWLDDFANADQLEPLLNLLKEWGTLQPREEHVDLQTLAESTLSVEELAEQQGISREGYIRAVKRQTGLSPHAYRNNQRIERAKQLIAQGLSLVDVALAVGYQDQSQFHKHFVHFTAATPKQYQGSLASSGS